MCAYTMMVQIKSNRFPNQISRDLIWTQHHRYLSNLILLTHLQLNSLDQRNFDWLVLLLTSKSNYTNSTICHYVVLDTTYFHMFPFKIYSIVCITIVILVLGRSIYLHIFNHKPHAIHSYIHIHNMNFDILACPWELKVCSIVR